MTTNSYDWLTNTELNTVALQAQRHNDQRARGHNPQGSTQQTLITLRCAWQRQAQPNIDAEALKSSWRSMARTRNLRGRC